MPTYGYLHDRFADHQALLGQPDTEAPRATVVACAVCGQEGASAAWLSAHLRATHPLAAPLLSVGGRPLPAGIPVPLRSAVIAQAVATANATGAGISVDGGPCEDLSPDELGPRLAALEHGFVSIHLRNERADGAEARRRFDLHLSIPRPEELDAVDACFASIVGPETTVEQLDHFADEAASLRSARSYAGALHAYLRGILQKDGRLRGAGFEYAKHRDQLNNALHELGLYSARPLASALAGVIRFNLNLLPFSRRSGIVELDACAAHLAALAAKEKPRQCPRPVAAEIAGTCPVDDATHALLQLHGDLADDGRRRGAVTALLRVAAAPRTTPTDAAKARALALSDSTALSHDEQRRAAAALSNDPLFAGFAATVLRT